jgi:hypothetical protein
MGIQRLISLILLVVGLYLLGRDAATLIAGSGAGPEALDTLWRRLDASSFDSFQSFVQRHLPNGVWDPGIATILHLPAWTLPLGIGGILLGFDILSQRRSS